MLSPTLFRVKTNALRGSSALPLFPLRPPPRPARAHGSGSVSALLDEQGLCRISKLDALLLERLVNPQIDGLLDVHVGVEVGHTNEI